MISATGEEFHSVALTGGCQDSPNAHAKLRNRRAPAWLVCHNQREPSGLNTRCTHGSRLSHRKSLRLAIELSATRLCELVPDIPIMPKFRNAPLKWIKPANTEEQAVALFGNPGLTRPGKSTNDVTTPVKTASSASSKAASRKGWP